MSRQRAMQERERKKYEGIEKMVRYLYYMEKKLLSWTQSGPLWQFPDII